jgi:membrane protease YdiL (CAAX protease family)
LEKKQRDFLNSVEGQEAKKYSLWDILLVLLLFVFLVSIFSVFFPHGIPILYMLVLSCFYVAVILIWTLKYRKWSKADLGLVGFLDEKNFWIGIGVGLSLAFVIVGIDTSTVYLLLHEPKLTLASALEEVIYRGFLFSLIKNKFGLFAGIIVSSLLFSLSHTVSVGNPSVESIYAVKVIAYIQKFILGAAFAYLFAETGSLSGPTLAHITFNWCGYIVYTLVYCPR